LAIFGVCGCRTEIPSGNGFGVQWKVVKTCSQATIVVIQAGALTHTLHVPSTDVLLYSLFHIRVDVATNDRQVTAPRKLPNCVTVREQTCTAVITVIHVLLFPSQSRTNDSNSIVTIRIL
jgi:hypothetical protein